jgi:hypothetical protein
MSEYCDCYDKFVWSNCEPEDWEVTWEPTMWAATEDFASFDLMRALVSSSDSILVSFLICCKT